MRYFQNSKLKLKKKLIDFEKKIETLYEKKKIRGPIHLSGNNEDELINIFKKIKKNDWVFSGWRNHYHAILKNIPLHHIEKQIIKGKSMNLNSMKHNFFTSSIVGGILPVSLGVAMALKMKKANLRFGFLLEI